MPPRVPSGPEACLNPSFEWGRLAQTTRRDHGIHIQQTLWNSPPSRLSLRTYSPAQVLLPSPPPSPACTITTPSRGESSGTHLFVQGSSTRSPSHSAASLFLSLSSRRSPPRCTPSVGVSLLCHCPATSPLTMLHMPRATSPPLPPSRPLSPGVIDHPPRPPSRSESLLRDTLRRAEEHERRQGGPSTVVRSPRGRKASYLGSAGSPDDFADGEGGGTEVIDAHVPSRHGPSFDYLLRIPPVTAVAPRPMRRRSTSRASRGVPDAAFYPYGSPSSPSPMPPMLPRTHTEPAVFTQKRRSTRDHLAPLPSSSAQSQLHVQVQGRTLRTSHAPSSHSQSHTSSVDTSPRHRPINLSPVSPHEAVLRARLEGVLKNVSSRVVDEQDNEGKSPRDSHRRTKSHTPITGQNLATLTDWTSSSENSSRHVSVLV